MSIRVIQWGIGKVGREALRGIARNPQLQLVGAWKHSREGTDRDVGEYCGTDHLGLRATTDSASLLRCEADCVLYMPRMSSLDDVCALLASGKNVICTPFLFYAHAMSSADSDRILAACEAGQSSLYGTGINPGAIGMVLPLAMTTMSRDIKRTSVFEKANWSFYNNPQITFDNMRFGHPIEDALLEANPFARFNSQIFQEQIHMLADAWSVQLDEVRTDQDLVVSEREFEIICGKVDAGTVYGQRYHWQGLRDGQVIIEIDALWTIGDQYPEHWPKPQDGWTIRIEGSPSMQTHFLSCASFDGSSGASLEDHIHAADVATATAAVNAISGVCKANPGIVTARDLAPALPFNPFGQV